MAIAARNPAACRFRLFRRRCWCRRSRSRRRTSRRTGRRCCRSRWRGDEREAFPGVEAERARGRAGEGASLRVGAAPGLLERGCVCLNVGAFGQAAGDTLLRAMRDELSRSRGLKVLSLEAPYFIEYTIEDGDSFEVSASLGGLVSVRHNRFRLPEIKVRVGDYKFDNTGYAGSGLHFGTHYDIERFPLENSYEVMRRFLWLDTDSAYKSAVEAISRKRAALKNVSVNQPLDDFAKAEPLKKNIGH